MILTFKILKGVNSATRVREVSRFYDGQRVEQIGEECLRSKGIRSVVNRYGLQGRQSIPVREDALAKYSMHYRDCRDEAMTAAGQTLTQNAADCCSMALLNL
jgi:hypothetical protein